MQFRSTGARQLLWVVALEQVDTDDVRPAHMAGQFATFTGQLTQVAHRDALLNTIDEQEVAAVRAAAQQPGGTAQVPNLREERELFSAANEGNRAQGRVNQCRDVVTPEQRVRHVAHSDHGDNVLVHLTVETHGQAWVQQHIAKLPSVLAGDDTMVGLGLAARMVPHSASTAACTLGPYQLCP